MFGDFLEMFLLLIYFNFFVIREHTGHKSEPCEIHFMLENMGLCWRIICVRRSISGFCSVPFVSKFVISLILHCLDYDSFIGLRPAGVNVLTILVFQNSFGSFSSLAFP